MWFTPQLFLSLFVWRCVIFPRTKVQCKHSVTMIFIDWHCQWIVGTRTGRKLKAYMSTEGNNPKVSGTDGFESIECAIWPTVHHKATMHDTKIERSGQWTHPIFRNHRCCSVLRKKKKNMKRVITQPDTPDTHKHNPQLTTRYNICFYLS